MVSAFAAASLFMAGHVALTAMLRARYRFWAAESAIACGKWLAAIFSLSALPSIGLTSGLGFRVGHVRREALTFTVAAILVNRADSPRWSQRHHTSAC